MKLKLIKIQQPKSGNWFGIETAYMVDVDGKIIGVVWSRRGFSYRGTQGWNRGIRVRDFHPIEWHFGAKIGQPHRDSFGRHSRKYAVEALLESSQVASERSP